MAAAAETGRRRGHRLLRRTLPALLVAAVLAPTPATAARDDALRARWADFVARYETERDRLLAGELCAASWSGFAVAVDGFAPRLEERLGRRRLAAATRDLEALERRLEREVADCDAHLLERYRAALQRHREVAVTIETALAEERVPERLHDRVAVLRRAATEAVRRGDAREAGDGGAVLAVEASARWLWESFLATDPCADRLAALARSGEGAEEVEGAEGVAATVDELCRIAAAPCLWPTHREAARTMLAEIDREARCDSAAAEREAGGG